MSAVETVFVMRILPHRQRYVYCSLVLCHVTLLLSRDSVIDAAVCRGRRPHPSVRARYCIKLRHPGTVGAQPAAVPGGAFTLLPSPSGTTTGVFSQPQYPGVPSHCYPHPRVPSPGCSASRTRGCHPTVDNISAARRAGAARPVRSTRPGTSP